VHARARRRIATLLLPVGVLLMSTIAAGLIALTGAPAGATGILPPANPPANIAPDSADWLQSINDARAQEGVGPMDVSESALSALPLDQQVFTVVNDERIDRGLPPIDYLTSQLDGDAQAGANAGTDPSFPPAVTGGAPITYGGAIWAGGLTSVLEADYYWMYDDGYGGSSTTNAACSSASSSSCWGHRDIILHGYANCPSGAPVLSMGAAYSPGGYSGGSIAAIFVSSCSPPTDITSTWGQVASEVESGSRTIGIAPLSNGTGYWEVEGDGTVAAFGAAQNFGSVPGALNSPIVGIAATPDGGGYWLVGADGGIFSFGDASFYGSTGSLRLNKPIVGMAATPDGKGYWLVASDGGIFSFGDAAFYGSMGGSPLNQPIVGMADDPATGGYWEVAADGGIFSYNAPFFGSTGSIHLNKPIVGMEASPNGQGYRFVASDGGIFTFGQAPFDGSTGSIPLVAPVVGMAPDNATNGYWMAAADGGIFTFGGASYMGRLVSASG
jgi:ribosomal protein L24E